MAVRHPGSDKVQIFMCQLGAEWSRVSLCGGCSSFNSCG